MPSQGFRRLRRGAALVTVLMVIAMAVILSSALIASAFFQLDMSLNFDNVKVAKNMADSAVAAAAQRLMASYPSTTPSGTPADIIITGPTGGLLLASPGYSVNGELERSDTMKGEVTFKQTGTLPWSLDNLGPDTVSRSGYGGQAVPANAMHLIGIGTYKGATAYTDAVIWVPPYPYAIAASGKININGTVIVGSVPNSSSASASGSIVPTSSLLPAAMGDTNTGAPAISMSPGAGNSVYVAGDVQTEGTVYENGTVIINGQLMQNSAGFPIPSVTVTSYDPSGKAGCNTLSPCAAPTTLQLTGYNVVNVSPSATYTTQNINLNGGILYVKGGGTLYAQTISGNGAIMSEGNVTINQDANLSSDDTLALLSNGNVTINGTSSSTSTFQGLLYTQGNLTANDITVIGEYVANAGTATTSVGDVTLNNSNVIVANDKTTLTNWPSSTATSSGSSSTVFPGWTSSPLQILSGSPIQVPVGSFTVTSQMTFNGSSYVINATAAPVGSVGTYGPVTVSYTLNGSPPSYSGFPIVTWSPSTPTAMMSAFTPLYKSFGISSNNSKIDATGMAEGEVNDASPHWGTSPSASATTPSPVPMTPNPFSFNNFLSNPTQNARVLMWQPYLP